MDIHNDTNGLQRNTRLLEFALVFFVVVICLWLITPGISDGIRLSHETTVKHSASAMRDSLRLLQIQRQAALGDVAEAQKILDSLQRREQILTRETCARLWQAFLGESAPTAHITGAAIFGVQLVLDSDQHLGCRYQYRLAGKLFIDYFPLMNNIVVDDVF